jgi:phenylalanyl-tRNA synthetase beta chain
MNIRITHSWLLEYLDTKADPYEIQKYLSLCGPSIEQVDKLENGDYAYDIEITSNRVDTASVIGIAREAATILTRFGFPSTFRSPWPEEPETPEKSLPLEITDHEGSCRRILAVIMDDVRVADSDPVIKSRLEAAGIRSLNNLVDVTNYVMMEIGHPTHVFDYDRIGTNRFLIRHAKKGETIVTLDGKKYLLNDKDIIIDDGTGRIVDLPGIMGTENSVVTDDTKRIIFFIESNDPVAIRGSSMRYGIRTMAATINEKSPDFNLAKVALLRGIELFRKHAHARVASGIIDLYRNKPETPRIETSVGFINKRIGVALPQSQIVSILKQLEFAVEEKGDNLSIDVPSFRSSDVSIPEDIVEEVARIYGYHNLPNALSPAAYVKQPPEMEELFVYQSKIKTFLKHMGLNEVLNYSMISKEMLENLGMDPEKHLHLANVMSEEIKYLRTSLLPSLVKNIKTNEGRAVNLKLFELAKVYEPRENSLPEESYKLGIAVNTSLHDLKGIVEALLSELHIESYSFDTGDNAVFAQNASLKLSVNGVIAGNIGALKLTYAQKTGMKSECFLAELDFKNLIRFRKAVAVYRHLHPYAVIKLDRTVELTQASGYEALRRTAFETSKLLVKLDVVDTYKNRVTLRYYFSSPSRNITDEEAKKELEAISRL